MFVQERIWGVLTVLVLINIWLVESQPMPGSHRPHILPVGRPQEPGDKVWLFTVSGTIAPFSFFTDSGKFGGFTADFIDLGFTADFIDLVCRVAGKTCHLTVAPFTQCSYTKGTVNYPGEGLMAGWFDGCPGYAKTEERVDIFDFTLPYLRTEAAFAVAAGNPRNFDPKSNDFTNYTLVLLTGTDTSIYCLNRLGKKFGKTIIVEDKSEARDLLIKGQADAFFYPVLNAPADLEVLPDRFHCDMDGLSIMTKKGNELHKWWNAAFTKLVNKGIYARFCAKAGKKYQFDFECISKNTLSFTLKNEIPLYNIEKALKKSFKFTNF